MAVLGSIIFLLVLFGGLPALMLLFAVWQNRNYAFLHPDDPFSVGVDAAWKGKGPPPSEQEWRAAEILREAAAPSLPIPSGDPAVSVARVKAELAAAAKVRAARRLRRDNEV